MRHADLGGEALWRGGHRRGVCSSQIKQMFTVAVCVRKNKHSFKPPSTDPPPPRANKPCLLGRRALWPTPICLAHKGIIERAVKSEEDGAVVHFCPPPPPPPPPPLSDGPGTDKRGCSVQALFWPLHLNKMKQQTLLVMISSRVLTKIGIAVF